jgi:hypothetical protein
VAWLGGLLEGWLRCGSFGGYRSVPGSGFGDVTRSRPRVFGDLKWIWFYASVQ